MGSKLEKLKSLLILSISKVKHKRLKLDRAFIIDESNKWIKELEAKIKPKELRLEG